MSAFEFAWALLKSTPRKNYSNEGLKTRTPKRTASLRTGAQPIDTQSEQAQIDRASFMEPDQRQADTWDEWQAIGGGEFDWRDRRSVDEILFDDYGYGVDDEMAEALLQHSPASANLRQYQYDERRPEPMYDDEGKVIGDAKDSSKH